MNWGYPYFRKPPNGHGDFLLIQNGGCLMGFQPWRPLLPLPSASVALHGAGTARQTWRSPSHHVHQRCPAAAKTWLPHGDPRGSAHGSSSPAAKHVVPAPAPHRNSPGVSIADWRWTCPSFDCANVSAPHWPWQQIQCPGTCSSQ